jgi:TRAP transporter TAXI family solute receptor
MTNRIKLILACCATAFSSTGAAQIDNPDMMGVVTGSSAGTYIQFARDMASVTEASGLRLLVKESQGSLDNIRRMVSKENAAAGIVQSDVLGFLTRSTEERMRRVAARLRLIFPFYNEEIHLYARRDIRTFSELQGKRVVVGTKGSGNWLTSTNLLHMVGIEPGERLYMNPAAGATAVLTGSADAMFYVAGKPVKLFTNIEQLANNPKYQELIKEVHMVPLNDPKMLQEYANASLGPADYSWMAEEIPTIAVKALLVGFDFSSRKTPYYSKRCNELRILGDAVRSNIDELRRSGHPKWSEVNLDEDIGLWQRDRCSMEEASTAGSRRADQDDFLSRELEKCILTGTCE